MFYDFGTLDDWEWLVEEIVDHKWDKGRLYLHVHWNMGDFMWESLQECQNLQALDDYLQLFGVHSPTDLTQTRHAQQHMRANPPDR